MKRYSDFMHMHNIVMIGTSDKLVDALDLLKERAEEADPNSLFALVNDLSKVCPTICV